MVDADPTSESYGWAMTSGLEDDPLVVTGDVFVSYSDFGWDYAAGAAGPDMDMMGCDGVLGISQEIVTAASVKMVHGI